MFNEVLNPSPHEQDTITADLAAQELFGSPERTEFHQYRMLEFSRNLSPNHDDAHCIHSFLRT